MTAYEGFPIWEATYRPFGEEHVAAGGAPPLAPSSNHYKFTGKERDTESGFDYFGARYYVSLTGRFQTPDLPFIDQRPTNPQSWNLFAYGRNNPTNIVDPTGNASEAIHCSGGGALASCAPYERNDGEDAAPTVTIDVETERESSTSNAVRILAYALGGGNPQVVAIALQIHNQVYGANLSGPYVADLNSPEIKTLLDPNHTPSQSDMIGNGECVTATTHFAKGLTGRTARWRAGPKVVNEDSKTVNSIEAGTAIATFDSNGRYPTGPQKNSGIYLGSGVNGSIWILDQWPERRGRAAHPPQPREVLFDPGRSISDNSGAYYVILVAR
jgi:RHS repeat-associated protein